MTEARNQDVPAPHAPNDQQIATVILSLTAGRGPGASICPSEAARVLADAAVMPDWRALMAPVRRVAAGLARSGHIDILRKGKSIDPATMHGVVRLRTRPSGDES